MPGLKGTSLKIKKEPVDGSAAAAGGERGGVVTPVALKRRDGAPRASPFMENLRRKSVSLLTSPVRGLQSLRFRDKLRLIAPLRIWSMLGFMIVTILLLLWAVLFVLHRLQMQALPAVNASKHDHRLGIEWTKNGNVRTAALVLTTCLITTGVNGLVMWKIALRNAEARVAAVSLQVAKRAPSFIERRLPGVAKFLPDNYHEVALYLIQFVVVFQGLKVWRGWQSSPIHSVITKWEGSELNRVLRNRRLRRIQKGVSKELAELARKKRLAQQARQVATRGGGVVREILRFSR